MEKKNVPFGQTNPEDKKERNTVQILLGQKFYLESHPSELGVSSWFLVPGSWF